MNKAKVKLHSKSIAQYDLLGNYIRKFKSANEAARITNDSQGNISAVALGKRNYSGKYQYAYIEDNVIPIRKAVEKVENFQKEVLQLDIKSDKIIMEHKSISDAAKAVCGSQSNISACIKGKRKTAYGYLWAFK